MLAKGNEKIFVYTCLKCGRVTFRQLVICMLAAQRAYQQVLRTPFHFRYETLFEQRILASLAVRYFEETDLGGWGWCAGAWIQHQPEKSIESPKLLKGLQR